MSGVGELKIEPKGKGPSEGINRDKEMNGSRRRIISEFYREWKHFCFPICKTGALLTAGTIYFQSIIKTF